MKTTLIHRLEIHANMPLTIGQLRAMLDQAERAGFDSASTVSIRAGTDARDHDYYFHATIEKGENEASCG